MPRVKASPKKCVKSNIQQPPNSWVFMLKGEALELSDQYTGTGTPDIVTLRHPNTGEPAIFLFSPANNSVQEVLTFSDGKRSWFFDDSVKSDGKMHLSTPIDPIFLVLPYLRKYCNTQAVPLEQLLKDDDFPETERLLKSNGLKYLSTISDKKGESIEAFRYNEEKTLLWLKKKTERVADILRQKRIHVGGSSATSATFIKPSNSTSSNEVAGAKDESQNLAYLRYAAGIVSEYLMDDLSKKLFNYLNLPDESTTVGITGSLKRKSTLDGTASAQPQTHDSVTSTKRSRSSTSNQTQQASTIVTNSNLPPTITSSALDLSSKPIVGTPKQLPGTKIGMSKETAKDRARSKAAQGSKSITSYFTKKS